MAKPNQIDYVLGEDLQFIPADANESIGGVHGSLKILGKLVGTHFVPDGESRNGRWYPRQLWYEQLEKPYVREKLANNTMIGSIGHDLEINEKAFREGMVSHYTTNLRIEQTSDPKRPYRGIGESVILDTPAGRALKAGLDGGMKFWVSSRADGDFLPGQYHRTSEGKELPILDSSKYRLERFDMVLNPGFLEARPELQEDLGITEELLRAINESYQEFENNVTEVPIKENSMDKASQIIKANKDSELITKATGDLVIKVTDDNEVSITRANSTPSNAKGTEHPHDKICTLPKDDGTADNGKSPQNTLNLTEGLMTDLLKRNEELQAEINALREAVASDNDPDILADADKRRSDRIKEIDPEGVAGGGKISKQNTADLLASLKKFEEEYGSLEHVAGLLEVMSAFHEEYGSPAEIADFMRDSVDFHEEFGSQDDIADSLAVTEAVFEDMGDPDYVMNTLDGVKEFFETYGDPEDIVELAESVIAFSDAHGTLEDAGAMLSECYQLFEEVGTPADIRINKQLVETMNAKIQTFNDLGLDNIEEMKVALQDIKDIKLQNEALSISEHTGLNSNVILDHIKSGMSERQIVDLYNRDNEYRSHRKFLTVRENVDKIPLKMVDPDGDHVQMKNAFCVNKADESLLDIALGQIKMNENV